MSIASDNATEEREPLNPFVGPGWLETGQKIFGRNREIEELYYLLCAERIVMLYSPSGAGKSSLIRAGLVPRLDAAFDVWGPVRVNMAPGVGPENRYVRSVKLEIEATIPEDFRRKEAEIANQTLREYFAERPRRADAPGSTVLIIDQFEELLTSDPADAPAKEEFFRQLGELLGDRSVWLLLALREDYLAQFDPYALKVPTHLKNRYRLDLLTRAQATEAMEETVGEGWPKRAFEPTVDARTAGKDKPTVATDLAAGLSKIKVQQLDGHFDEAEGAYVEPLHLQVVCRRLWNSLSAEQLLIGAENIRVMGSVEDALAEYYRLSVAKIAGGDSYMERAIRDWAGSLVTRDGVRRQVLRNKDSSEGLDNKLIGALVENHLVRPEIRGNATWYELTHDRLAGAVLVDNRDWRENNLSHMQQEADEWAHAGKRPEQLLAGADLRKAVQWASKNDAALNASDREFLRQSLDAETVRSGNRLRWAIWAMPVALLIILGMWINARTNLKSTRVTEIASVALSSSDAPDTAALFALEAQATGADHLFPGWLIKVFARRARGKIEADVQSALFSAAVEHDPHYVKTIQVNHAGDVPACLSFERGKQYKTLYAFVVQDRHQDPSTIKPVEVNTEAGTIGTRPSDQDMESCSGDGEDFEGDLPPGWTLHGSELVHTVGSLRKTFTLLSSTSHSQVGFVSISPDEKYAAFTLHGRNMIAVSPLDSRPPQDKNIYLQMPPDSKPQGLRFSPAAHILAAATQDSILLWDLVGATVSHPPDPAVLDAHSNYIEDIVFSGNEETMYSAGDDGRIVVWKAFLRSPESATETANEIVGFDFIPGIARFDLALGEGHYADTLLVHPIGNTKPGSDAITKIKLLSSDIENMAGAAPGKVVAIARRVNGSSPGENGNRTKQGPAQQPWSICTVNLRGPAVQNACTDVDGKHPDDKPGQAERNSDGDGEWVQVSVDSGGRWAIIGDSDGRLELWDVNGFGAPSHRATYSPREQSALSGRVTALDVSADGKEVVAGYLDNTIQFFSVSGDQISQHGSPVATPKTPDVLRFRPVTPWIAILQSDHSLWFRDSVTGKAVGGRMPLNFRGAEPAVEFSQDGSELQILAEGIRDAIRLGLDAQTGDLSRQACKSIPTRFKPSILRLHLANVGDAGFQPDCSHFLAADSRR